MKKILKVGLLAILLLVLFLGWGSVGHKIINGEGARNFPDVNIMTSSVIKRLTDSASVPDYRSGYEPKHYMDMDALPEYYNRSITHNLDSLFMKYGEYYIRNDIGFLPWVIDSVMTALTKQMIAKDWNRAWSTAADLGHYIADSHQPLHATKYYNGNTSLYGSGSYGIHSRYESTMISNYQSSILISQASVSYISSPLDTAFEIMYESCSYTDSILIADYNARVSTGSSTSSAYYAALWQQLALITIRQFQRASDAYGSFLYTAWVNAGSPSTFVEGLSNRISDFKLYQNYPNPFNPTTTIRFDIPAIRPSEGRNESNRLSEGYVSVKLFDILGKEIATLVNDTKEPGSYEVQFNASQLASGIYFYKLQAGPFIAVKKLILLR